MGRATPVVSGLRVFTIETKDKKVEIVTTFDRKSGKELWRAKWAGAVSAPFFAKSNGDRMQAAGALPGLGELRRRVELYSVAVEALNY